MKALSTCPYVGAGVIRHFLNIRSLYGEYSATGPPTDRLSGPPYIACYTNLAHTILDLGALIMSVKIKHYRKINILYKIINDSGN